MTEHRVPPTRVGEPSLVDHLLRRRDRLTTAPQPRCSIQSIPPYVPGRPPTPREGLRSYKLSSNENPYPPLPGVLAASAEAAAGMNRYPDLGSSVLHDALAARLEVPTEHLAVATGSVALIYQLLQAFCEPGDEVIHAWRSFEAYPIAASVAAATSVRVPLTVDGRHDLDAMLTAITPRTRVILVCTPNNPTGPAVTQAELDAFLAVVPSRVLVVLDEAYAEFVRMADPVDGVTTYRRHENVVVTRTFSKAYGLAGLRVGYAVGPAPITAALRAVSLPFGVTAIAQAAAVASLSAQPALAERVETLVAERVRVLDGLRRAGLDVPDAQGNFVWLGFGDDASDFAVACERAGIVVRPFAGDGVRASIGEPEANDRLVEIATEWTTTRTRAS
ncbi:histidinol-phosphate transaminase [Nocardioides bigeumensis]|uniref:histidinol-phosphate transaminase n=1 Tax=Nocardioides bigeumensis TaxID=433657 RepID=UPI0031E22505